MLDALKAKFVDDKAADCRLCRGTIGADHSMHLAEKRLDFRGKATSNSIGPENHAPVKLITPSPRRPVPSHLQERLDGESKRHAPQVHASAPMCLGQRGIATCTYKSVASVMEF